LGKDWCASRHSRQVAEKWLSTWARSALAKALHEAKAQEGNPDFQVHRAPSGNLQAICLLPIMPLAYAGAWLRRYEETHILSSC